MAAKWGLPARRKAALAAEMAASRHRRRAAGHGETNRRRINHLQRWREGFRFGRARARAPGAEPRAGPLLYFR